MKSTVSTMETFKYILIFTFLFAAFLALAITYNKVYKLKNESISIIEKYEGVSVKTSIPIINNYLTNSGYNVKGNCSSDEYGVKSLNYDDFEKSSSNQKYAYCIKEKKVDDRYYYELKLFFKFNLPFIGDLFTFNITGETKAIKIYDDSQGMEGQ